MAGARTWTGQAQLTRRRLLELMGAGTAAGIGLGAAGLGANLAAAADSIDLEFWTISLKGPFTDWVEEIINDFQKANAGVKIKWVDVPGSSVAQKYLAAVAANQAPDVANMYQLPRFVEMGAVLDVTPYVPADQKADFFPSFWDALTFNGKIYGVPWYANSATLLYSKKVYQDAGLDPAKPAKTWDDVLANGKVIQDKTGKYGPALSFADGNSILGILQQEGIALLSEDKKTATLNTQQAADIVQRWVDGYKAGAIPPEATTATGDDAVSWFLSGRAGSFPGGAWILNRTTPQVIKQMSFAVAPGIVGAPGKYQAGFQFLSMSAKTKHPKEAVAFALHAAAGKYQLELAKRVAVLPSNKSGMDDPFWKQQPTSLEQEATLMSAKQLDSSVVLYSSAPPVVEWSRMVDAVAKKMGDLFSGSLKPADFLSQTESEWNTILKGG